jgi:hypothetical protein
MPNNRLLRIAEYSFSIARGNGQVCEEHVAVSLGPQIDSAGDRLFRCVLKEEFAVEVTLDIRVSNS